MSNDFSHWYKRQGPRCVILPDAAAVSAFAPPRSSSVNAKENSAIMSIHGLEFEC